MRLLFIYILFSSSIVFASNKLNHSCFVAEVIQEFNFKTGESIFLKGRSELFPVTKLEHQEAFFVEIKSDDGKGMASAKVSTGTLLGTVEGDVIQAAAYLTIFGNEEYLGLVTSTESPMARSHRVFENNSEEKITLINVDLKCEINRQ